MVKLLRRQKLSLTTALVGLAVSACAIQPAKQQRPATVTNAGSAVYTTSLRSTGSPLDQAPPTHRYEAEIHLAVRFVSYLDREGRPTAPRSLARAFIDRANEIYKACDIHFELEQYLAVHPKGVPYHLSSMDDLDPTRAQFDEPNRLVIIDTGNWNHNGMGTANAWTALPGTSPSGAVLEAAANDHAELIAHELGHYLNLDHVNDAHNLMNPIIYHSSVHLDDGQCHMMRNTALTARMASLR